MPRISSKRDQLLTAAKDLIHEQGYGPTTLAHISERSGVPLGNVYYYFKTKEELAKAVIETRQSEMHNLRQQCEQKDDPKQRLLHMIHILKNNWANSATTYGCPIGSLCQELNKTNLPIRNNADELLVQHLKWLKKQFKDLGHSKPHDSATYFLSVIQGASLLANSLKDRKILSKQLVQLTRWLESK